VARQRYIRAVQEYNVTVRSFPNNLTAMMFGYKVKPSFTWKTRRRSRNAEGGLLETRVRSRAGAEQIKHMTFLTRAAGLQRCCSSACVPSPRIGRSRR